MDKITSETWLKVYHNDLVFIKILEMFDLEEQIALIPVCQRFQYIITDVIWKKKLRDLLIQKADTSYAIGWREPAMTNKSHTICGNRELGEREIVEFLEYIKSHLKSLKVSSSVSAERKVSHKGLAFNFLGSFENLQVLEYYNVILKDENIKSISENCKQLKKLSLICAGRKLTGKYLNELSNLESFHIECGNMTWSHEKLLNFCKLSLKTVHLYSLLFGKKDTNVICDTESLTRTLEVLKLKCHEFDSDDAFDILRYSSKPFALLQELEMCQDSHVKSHHFDLISEKCLNLQILHITRATFEVYNLKCAFNLKELYIYYCHTVSPEIAWYILTKLNLTELQISYIDSRKTYNFDYSLALGCSLKTLGWITNEENKSGKEFWMEILENCCSDSFRQLVCINGRGINDYHMKFISQKFEKIQHLHIYDSTLSGRYIYLLKNVENLTLSESGGIDFLHLVKILQTVRRLESLSTRVSVIQKLHPDDDLRVRVPSIGSCSLRKLSIDYEHFLYCQPFWLNLLRSNLLKIEIICEWEIFSTEFDYGFLLAVFEDSDISKNINRFVANGEFCMDKIEDREYLVEIIYHPSLRNHLRSLYIDDNQIDTSLDKSECWKLIPLWLDWSNKFTIEFK